MKTKHTPEESRIAKTYRKHLLYSRRYLKGGRAGGMKTVTMTAAECTRLRRYLEALGVPHTVTYNGEMREVRYDAPASNETETANAALIAAAPSMETALERIRELMKNAPHVVTTDPDFYDWHDRMWKARCLAENVLLTAHGMSQDGVTPIAKAEGRTP